MSDDANLTGRGAEILLPPQGNPFKSNPAGSEPADLTPTDVAARFDPQFGSMGGMGKAQTPGTAAMEDGVGGEEEPADLTPEDIAAMFPASQAERNTVPEPVGPAATAFAPVEEEPAPTALTPEQIAEMVAEQPAPTPEPPARQGARMDARVQMGVSDRGRQPKPQIDIDAFDPDKPIGKPKKMGKFGARMGKVDIEAFDPDAPAGTAAEPIGDAAADAAFDPAGSIKADLMPTDASMDAFAGETNAPLSIPASEGQSFPADGFSTPVSEPALDPMAASDPAPTPPASLAPVGFRPFDPFAPSSEQSLTGAESAPALPVIGSPDSSIEPELSTAVLGSSSASTVEPPRMAAGPVSTAVLTDDSDPTSGHDRHLPTAPSISLPVVEEESMLNSLVTDNRVQELWARIDAAERLAVADESSLPEQRDRNFENIKTARHVLLGGRRNYEDALRYLTEVESDLSYAKRVRQWSYTHGLGVLVYNLFWLALLGFAYSMANQVAAGVAGTGVVDQSLGFKLWVTMLLGGLGGVSKSLFSLAQHVSKQDFDSQHLMWYWTSPLIGAVLGIFVMLVAQVGLITLSAGTTETGDAGWLVYILAWVVGFQQNLVLQLVEKVKEAILPEKK